jgi:hypothetical protein
MISNKLLDPLYTTKNDGLAEGAMETLKQVLAQDPRASRKRGTSTRTTEASYRIVFCKVEVEFRVIDGTVEVINVVPADFSDEDFVDGIPLSKTHDAKTN